MNCGFFYCGYDASFFLIVKEINLNLITLECVCNHHINDMKIDANLGYLKLKYLKKEQYVKYSILE